ncbi:hypothetical protein BGW80DRAFT_697234 [Lactifluus volemus]|nr:hypothetical protein BGW80DRAFT_697234 [Lactifluus volemus]
MASYRGRRASVPIAEDTNHLETMPTPSFSKIDMDILAKVGICSGVGLVLSEDKRGEIEAEGKAPAAASGLSFDAIVQLIKVVRSRLMTEAGRRMLISIILLRVASTVHDEAQTLNIAPGFPVEATFEMAPDNYSFSGVIDYLLIRLSSQGSKEFFDFPAEYLLDMFRNESVTGAVIRAEQDNMEQAIPQAALTVASHCKEQELSVMRGCITSGEQWTFFVYKSPKASGRRGRVARIRREGEFHFSRRLNLGENLENLALVLGLLRDLANNALEHNQKYFSYEKRL